MDWGNQCLEPVVGEFACGVGLLEDVCDDGGYLFCSFLKDSSCSSGPVALFWLRFFNCLIIPFEPISRGGMLEYNEGSITGMGYLSLVNTYTEVNWLLRAFALSLSFVVGLSSTLRVGMPMCSRLFALMNDQNRFGFDLDCHQFGCLYRICRKLPML